MKVKISNLVSQWSGQMEQACQIVADKLIHSDLEDQTVDLLMGQLTFVMHYAESIKKQLIEAQNAAN